MKKYLCIPFLLFLSIACEDVVDVDLNTMDQKLVIEASINWIKGTRGNQQFIKLSLSAPYFDKSIQPATGAQVTITDQSNNVYPFLDDDIKGIYRNKNFIPKINHSYTLRIIYNGETYVGTETLIPVVNIDYVSQNVSGGFIGEQTELKAYYTDPEEETNFYFFEFTSNKVPIPTLEVYDDNFTNGNQIFGYYSEDDLLTDDYVLIRNHGISEQFYNYMFILLQQSTDGSGGPFETQPATVKGNCVNITNPDHSPLGYFRLSQVAEVIYTIQ